MKTPFRQSAILAVAIPSLFFINGAVLGQTDHGKMGMTSPSAMPADMTVGEVQKVDKAAGKVTLKHGPIRNMDMPGMTMAFPVKNKAALDKLKTRDRVRFTVADEHGTMVITDIQAAK